MCACQGVVTSSPNFDRLRHLHDVFEQRPIAGDVSCSTGVDDPVVIQDRPGVRIRL